MEEWLHLNAEGDAFTKSRFDLRKLELVISNYRQTIDQVLPLALGQKQITDKLKREIKYEVEIKNGSLDILLEFIWEHKEELISLFAVDGGVTLSYIISKLIEATIDLRRKFTKALEKGFNPKIIINKNIHNDYSVRTNIKNSNIEINNPIILLSAQNSKAPIDRLIEGIDGKQIEKIDIESKESSVNLSKKDLMIVGKQTQEINSDVELFGRLDMVAFTSHRGNIETGGRKYPVTWDEKIRKKIQKYADVKNIVFKVRPIIDHRRFKEDPIAFHILDCWDPQVKLDFK